MFQIYGVVECYRNSHSISSLCYHIAWDINYLYNVQQGEIGFRCRDLLIQIFKSENVHVLKGVVSKDYIHRHVE